MCIKSHLLYLGTYIPGNLPILLSKLRNLYFVCIEVLWGKIKHNSNVNRFPETSLHTASKILICLLYSCSEITHFQNWGRGRVHNYQLGK